MGILGGSLALVSLRNHSVMGLMTGDIRDIK